MRNSSCQVFRVIVTRLHDYLYLNRYSSDRDSACPTDWCSCSAQVSTILLYLPRTTIEQLLNDSPASLNASHVYVPESSGKISAIFRVYTLPWFVYSKSLLGLISLWLCSHTTSNLLAPILNDRKIITKQWLMRMEHTHDCGDTVPWPGDVFHSNNL
jgi:hypothetical protein